MSPELAARIQGMFRVEFDKKIAFWDSLDSETAEEWKVSAIDGNWVLCVVLDALIAESATKEQA